MSYTCIHKRNSTKFYAIILKNILAHAFTRHSLKVSITSVGILHIYNLWILLRKIVIYILSAENFIFIDFFAVKVDGSDVNPGICLYENSLQILGLTSLPSTLTANKSMNMKFSADKIYNIFFRQNSKIANM